MVGLGFACAATGAGISVTLIDRLPLEASLKSAFDGRVSAIAAGSARLLKTLGIWQGIEGEKQPILEIRVSDTESPLFLHYDHRDVGDEPLGHIVENRLPRRAMFARATRLPGLELRAPAEVATPDRHQDRLTATLPDRTLPPPPLEVQERGLTVEELRTQRHRHHDAAGIEARGREQSPRK